MFFKLLTTPSYMDTTSKNVGQGQKNAFSNKLHSTNKSDVNININAPKGVVRDVTAKSIQGSTLRVGFNMGGR